MAGLISPPVARLIGLTLAQTSVGRAQGELRVRNRHVGPGGTVHGGILCDLADATMGIAFASTLKQKQSAVTVELKINFLRPVWRERLFALARVVHRGRRLGLVDCEVSDGGGRLIAKASSTCMVLSRPLAPPPAFGPSGRASRTPPRRVSHPPTADEAGGGVVSRPTDKK